MINNGKDIPDIAWRVWNKYYMEGGNKVVTEYGHAFRAQCCSCGCRHCPFEPKHQGTKEFYFLLHIQFLQMFFQHQKK